MPIFANENPDIRPVGFGKILRWLLTRPRRQFAESRLEPHDHPTYPPPRGDIRVGFVGHATLVIEIAGKTILTDPVFSDRCSPVQWAGTRRYHPPGVRFESLPPIDIVLVTHNHYDHLDRPTIERLGAAPHYIVAEGLGPWFRARGCTRVTELPWWKSISEGPLQITATPCQHWSKRTPFDTMATHWCGFAIKSPDVSMLFIGDSGYSDGFKRIGERLGPFHVAALPIGAYEPRFVMQDNHMNPEEAVRAFEDVRAGVMMPTHFNCFPLTDEDPTEPARRLYLEWLARGHDADRLWLLAPGQYRSLEDMIYIPTVRSESSAPRERVNPDRAPSLDPLMRNRFAEWGVAICPHKGDMVDIEAVGHRDEVFVGDAGQTLTLDYVTCSSCGDLPQCESAACPLRDPAFLRGYGLHGSRRGDGSVEPFAEIDSPPEQRWWKEKLVVRRQEG